MKIKNDNLIIRVICLIISIVFWVMIMIDTDPKQTMTITDIPIAIRNLPSLENTNLVLMNQNTDNFIANVTISANIAQLNKVSRNDFTAYIDVLGFQEGTTNAEVKIFGPSGVEIKTKSPTYIACDIDSIISRVMDVTVQYEGNHSDQYYRLNGVTTPTSVKITGPRRIVNSADVAYATINVEGEKETITKTVPVRIYSGTGEEIFMTAPIENVQVSVPIYPTKYVNITPNIVGTPKDGYELVDISISPSRTRIAATQDVLDTVTDIKLKEINIEGAYNNIMSSGEIIDDKGLIFVDLKNPPVVSVLVDEIIETSLTYKIDDLEIINLPSNYKLEILDDENITVTMKGTKTILSQITKDDLKLTIDLSNVALGKSIVKVQTKTDRKIQEIYLNTDELEVEIAENNNTSDIEVLDNNTND